MEDRQQIMEEVMLFWKSRIVLTAAELDVFTALDEKPAGAPELAARIRTDARATERLLDALAAMGFLDKHEGLFHASRRGRLLSSRQQDNILPVVLHFKQLWQSWSQLTTVVRTGEPVQREGGETGESNRKAFIGAMHAIGREVSVELATGFDASRFKKLLDIGGASGTYTIAFLRGNPRMTAVLFDLPQVVPLAMERIAHEGLTERVTVVSGDFYTDELPRGCDLALLSAVIHQNSPEENVELCRKVFRALEPGGTVLIRDHVMDETHTQPAEGALFGVNMLVGTKGGATYSFAEVRETLERAGFTDVRWVRRGEHMDSLVTGTRPGMSGMGRQETI